MHLLHPKCEPELNVATRSGTAEVASAARLVKGEVAIPDRVSKSGTTAQLPRA